ncbi:MAG: Rpn family recombination-promoting nuclease/putative transposase, partial [Wolbachia sp.]
FFKYAEDTTDEDLRNIAEKSPIIKLAYDELDKFRWNEKDLIAYEERLMDLRKEEGILAQKLDDATEKGRQEGRAEGREEGIQIGHEKGRKEREIEVAKNLLKAGVSIDIIAQTTGLPKTEIAQLTEEVTS